MPSESAERIYEVAAKLFRERTYPSTSMRDIGQAVGILAGSLYSHIPSKEALLLDIVEAGLDRSLEAITPIVGSDDPPEVRLRAAIKAHVKVVAEHLEESVVTVHQWKYLSEDNRRRMVAKRDAYEKAFTQIVDDGVRTGIFSGVRDERLAVLGVLGMLNWVQEWFSPDGRHSVDEVGDILADLVLGGLMGKAPAPRAKRR